MHGDEDESDREEPDALPPILPPPPEIQDIGRADAGPITPRRSQEISDNSREDVPAHQNEEEGELEREHQRQEIEHQEIPAPQPDTELNRSDQKVKKNKFSMIVRRTPTRVLIDNTKSTTGKKGKDQTTIIQTSRLSKHMSAYRSSKRGRE